MIQLRVLGGAMSRVAADATAFAHRDAPVMFISIAPFEDPSSEPVHRAWTESLFEALEPHDAGVYSNFLGGRGRGSDPGRLSRWHLRAAGRHQAPIRPVEPVRPEPEHPAGPRRGLSGAVARHAIEAASLGRRRFGVSGSIVSTTLGPTWSDPCDPHPTSSSFIRATTSASRFSRSRQGRPSRRPAARSRLSTRSRTATR